MWLELIVRFELLWTVLTHIRIIYHNFQLILFFFHHLFIFFCLLVFRCLHLFLFLQMIICYNMITAHASNNYKYVCVFIYHFLDNPHFSDNSNHSAHSFVATYLTLKSLCWYVGERLILLMEEYHGCSKAGANKCTPTFSYLLYINMFTL